MTPLPVLYSFRRCPFAMRARMAIAISRTKVQLREVLLRDKPHLLLAASANATVPVLVDGDHTIDESLDIMDWALRQNDPEDWLASKNDPLITQNDGPFKYHLDRYKYASRYDISRRDEHRSAAFSFLENLDKRLRQRTFLDGKNRSFVDIALFPFVRQFRLADADWFDHTALCYVRRWLLALAGAPLFEAVMAKYPPWKESEPALVFPCA